MKNKEYELETIKDIIHNIPLEKLDYFLADFKNFILFSKKLSMATEELEELGVDIDKMFNRKFTWVDDGRHDIYVKTKLPRDV